MVTRPPGRSRSVVSSSRTSAFARRAKRGRASNRDKRSDFFIIDWNIGDSGLDHNPGLVEFLSFSTRMSRGDCGRLGVRGIPKGLKENNGKIRIMYTSIMWPGAVRGGLCGLVLLTAVLSPRGAWARARASPGSSRPASRPWCSRPPGAARRRPDPILPIYREREVGFVVRQLESRLLIVPKAFRGFEHGAMAQALAEGREDLEALVLDGPLPEGDPGALARGPATVRPSRCAGCSTARAPPPIPRARSTRMARCSRRRGASASASRCAGTTASRSSSP